MIDFKKFLNWGELSRNIANNRTSISATRISKKHEQNINELLDLIKEWYNKHYNK